MHFKHIKFTQLCDFPLFLFTNLEPYILQKKPFFLDVNLKLILRFCVLISQKKSPYQKKAFFLGVRLQRDLKNRLFLGGET